MSLKKGNKGTYGPKNSADRSLQTRHTKRRTPTNGVLLPSNGGDLTSAKTKYNTNASLVTGNKELVPTNTSLVGSSESLVNAIGDGSGDSPNRALIRPPALRAASRDRLMDPSLMDYYEFSQLAGLTFRNTTGRYRRDLYDALGYERNLTPTHYRGRYERGGVAARIVEAYPNATWSGGAEVIENQDEEIQTAFELKCEELFLKLDLWTNFLRADILAGLGPYSVIVMGAPGDMKTPLNKVTLEKLSYVRPVWCESAKIKELVDDTSDPRFGQPESYNVTFSRTTTAREVHWTRVIHVADGGLESNIYGKPRLRACWNDLDNLEKIVGGGSEAAWKRMDPGLQIDVDPTIIMGPDEEARFDEEVDNYEHGLERTIRTRGTKVTPLSAAVSAFGSNTNAIIDLIAAATSIPQRILMGSESGKLASEQDSDNWYSRVTERRRTYATPLIRRAINHFIELGALPEPAEGKFDVRWSLAERMDEAQKAALASSLANANAAQVNSEGRLIITAAEIRARIFKLDPLADEDAIPVAKDPGVGPGSTSGIIGGPTGDNGAGTGAVDPDEEVDNINAEPEQRAAAQSEQDAVLAVADKSVPRISATALALFAAISSSVSATKLEQDLSFGDAHGAERRIVNAMEAVTPSYQSRFSSDIRNTFNTAGKVALAASKFRGSWYSPSDSGSATSAVEDELSVSNLAHRNAAVEFPISFDISNPRAIRWARLESSFLITEINEKTRNAIRLMIARGLRDGIPPKRLATLIMQRIGLREDQVIALQNYAATDATTAQVAAYAKKLLRDRALLIARTEGAHAANAGQQELWEQAQEDGYLGVLQMRKWIGTDDGRERDEHIFINDQVQLIGVHFKKSDGSNIEPGQEPNCRCSQGLVSAKDAARLKRKQNAKGVA